MIRSLLTLSGLTVALALAGCASQPTSSAPAASKPSAAAAAPAVKDDVLAAKFQGTWTGQWSISGAGGKFELIVTEVQGTNVKGSANWYGTAVGDMKAPISKGVVKNGVLSVEQPGGWEFKVSHKDEKNLTGTWTVSGYTGDLKLSK